MFAVGEGADDPGAPVDALVLWSRCRSLDGERDFILVFARLMASIVKGELSDMNDGRGACRGAEAQGLFDLFVFCV